MNLPSKLIEDAVKEFTKLPGIGKKTALRLVLYLLKEETKNVEIFGETVIKMRQDIQFCQKCHNVSDQSVCSICLDLGHDQTTICVVENKRDVIAIENTYQYRGLYHVLGGVISPIEGIGPSDINIDQLLNRLKTDNVKELVMAISPTIEGDTTIFFISKEVKGTGVKVSTLARGISFGGELEYADEVTLGRSIVARIPYQDQGE